MKNLYIVLSFGLMSISLVAQNKDTKAADKLYSRYEYVDAAKAYQKLVDNGKGDGYVYKQLADTYYNMFNTAEATTWYAKATESTQDAETYFRYAQMLKSSGKYEEANKQMAKFAALSPNDQRAKTFKENPNYVPKLVGKTPGYTAKSLEVSSDKSDFGAVLYDNDLYFTSARNSSRKNYGWNEEPFLDIYKATLGDSGTFSEATTVSSLNSSFHDGPLTISTDGNTAYFTSDSFREGSFERDKKNKLKLGKNNIYKATKDGNGWGNVKSLSFNSKEYSTSNPSLSRDGKTLYFSSDMPNSLGGVDIWKVAVNEDGTYGTPENLGSKVNTEGNESFPFIADDNKTLFFASSGKQGLGGYDVYQIDLSNGSDAQNLGKPINTEKDDFAFTFNKAKNQGFFSSNRNGNDDIFSATPICSVDVLTTVTNAKTGATLASSKVSILDDKNNIIATETSNGNGEVKFKVECDKAYTIQASKDGFEGNTFPVAKTKGGETKITAALQPIDVIVTPTEIILKPVYFEYNKSNITQEGAFELDKLVQVMKNNDQIVIMVKAHTDSRGTDQYNLDLSDRRAKSTVQYVISKGISASRISGKGYGESEPKVQCEPCTEEEYSQNRRSEFLIVK
ncbi:OmpA family protein [Flavobacterium aquatile]|uniref:Cell envelope biogenesis protein OmpA n=1 Tax=Flavobacterium aquatile LMG 4008 = ATCC 11947 TaxID=1453498 RepID=A0A095SQX1_9FLAO|nr:OmpA family protein [Flavobacterium aquatile]KGD67051.1 cell envelope biogenesis protein OmpA [Flavobacterium aquatile LMG 4008 = ATCC 11947]OXA69124.1 cell envelope biogenesis protein OmpA [Flavobacterium aquatile LMG 4008 = ATCC 11947]GEC78344.1 cell envelope biogenesis protein OmpA [Flavobacterium aquatile]